MKIILQKSRVPRSRSAMTIMEMMISMMIYGLAIGALVSVNLFGLRQDQLVNSKLGANDMSRLSFNLMLDEIRCSKDVQIGFGSYTNFWVCTNGMLQQGDTLQIIPSTNINVFIWYYFNTNLTANDGTELCRIATGDAAPTIVCKYLTNNIAFQAFDYTGTNLLTMDPTNYNYNYVVGVSLQFFQYQYPLTMVGSNYFYNQYQLNFQATRRSP